MGSPHNLPILQGFRAFLKHAFASFLVLSAKCSYAGVVSLKPLCLLAATQAALQNGGPLADLKLSEHPPPHFLSSAGLLVCLHRYLIYALLLQIKRLRGSISVPKRYYVILHK
jgi:hypothetical protein